MFLQPDCAAILGGHRRNQGLMNLAESATGVAVGPPLLIIHELAKDFGGLRALNRCSFEVSAGSITGLIGPNGAGKTTLFNVVTGFIEPDGGQVFFGGEDITRLPPHQVFLRGLCRTFQIPREHQAMTVLENLMLVPKGQLGERGHNNLVRRRSVRDQEETNRAKALEVLSFFNLQDLAGEFAGNLSGGQKKLLELARTLMTDPKMVLLDEPAAGVNPTLLARIAEQIVQLRRERSLTFLVIEHDMNLVMSLCDTIVVLSEGSRIASGPPSAIRADPRVLEAYLGGQYAVAER